MVMMGLSERVFPCRWPSFCYIQIRTPACLLHHSTVQIKMDPTMVPKSKPPNTWWHRLQALKVSEPICARRPERTIPSRGSAKLYLKDCYWNDLVERTNSLVTASVAARSKHTATMAKTDDFIAKIDQYIRDTRPEMRQIEAELEEHRARSANRSPYAPSLQEDSLPAQPTESNDDAQASASRRETPLIGSLDTSEITETEPGLLCNSMITPSSSGSVPHEEDNRILSDSAENSDLEADNDDESICSTKKSA